MVAALIENHDSIPQYHFLGIEVRAISHTFTGNNFVLTFDILYAEKVITFHVLSAESYSKLQISL